MTGLHRKHAMRLLRGGQPSRRSGPRPDRRVYDDAVREALVVIWEASDRICGKRLRALVPTLVEAMERHGHVQLAPEVRASLLAMSAATMDRCLREARGQARSRDTAAHSPLDSGAQERAIADVPGLGRPSSGVRGGGPGVAQRADGQGQLRGDADADRHCDGLDRVRAGDLADCPTPGEAAAVTAPTEVTLEQLLFGLRTAWWEGEARPTSRSKEKAERGRRRPGPFAAVTAQVHDWFQAEPWRTARELFERLQAEQPGTYPDGQLRRLQRRLKGWRRDVAHTLVFGAAEASDGVQAGEATGAGA